MALPFILGLVIGGGVVYAYNNRDELQKQLKEKSKDLKSNLKKGQEALGKVRSRAKNLAQSLSADESTKGKRTRATKGTKATKSTAPKTTRRRRGAKSATETTATSATTTATEATLIPNSLN